MEIAPVLGIIPFFRITKWNGRIAIPEPRHNLIIEPESNAPEYA